MSVKLCLMAFICLLSTSINLFAASAKQLFAETFATAIVLSDNESLSIGIGNFNPEVLLKPHQHNFSDAFFEGDSVALRNELNIINVPYTFVLDTKSKQWSDKIMLKFTYIEQKSNHAIFATDNQIADSNVDKIFSLYAAYSHYLPLADKLKLRLRLGAYLMHHKNIHQYNNVQSNNIKPLVEGIYFNTIANAFIIEPNLKLTYTEPTKWGKWQFSSDWNYFKGNVFSGSASSIGAKPNGWRVNNGVKVHFDVNESDLHAESMYLNFRRIDMHGDMNAPLQADHYYEMGVGILLDIHKFTSLAENIGIGLNINRGTSLSGGSIVFYFNEF